MTSLFNPKKGLIVIPTKLYGPHGTTITQLALDTGATRTTINWHLIMLLGYSPSGREPRVQITTGSGIEFVPQVKILAIEALKKCRKNFTILCHTLPPTAMVDGVLGLDFLRSSALHIDFRNGTIVLN